MVEMLASAQGPPNFQKSPAILGRAFLYVLATKNFWFPVVTSSSLLQLFHEISQNFPRWLGVARILARQLARHN